MVVSKLKQLFLPSLTSSFC